MEEGRYMLIHNDKEVRRFQFYTDAHIYAFANCHGAYDFYVIVDLEEGKVVEEW